MILTLLILIPLIGGIVAWALAAVSTTATRWVCIATLAFDLLVLLIIRWVIGVPTGESSWLLRMQIPWMPGLGVSFLLAMDGISFLLVALTLFLGIIAVAASWIEIADHVGFFHFNIMWVLAGIIGVFLALDLFLFYFFWELMLIPMYLLIVIWGHERRIYASVKFFLFTQFGGLLMLIAIFGLVICHGRETGVYTFSYFDLLGFRLPHHTAIWLMLGFLAAFAVKLPAFPLHIWLPDAHTEAPTAGSVILAGLLLKTGAYGLIRFAIPLFPETARLLAPFAMSLAAAGILYGAILAFAQTDFKRLVAYTSVSHMGFVLLAVFAWNTLALQGAILQMLCHGFATGALFILAGILKDRLHTRDMNHMGGFWHQTPRMGVLALFFAMASLGLPGLGSFLGEFFSLAGAFQSSITWTTLASVGLIVATVYSLWMIQVVFFGPPRVIPLSDLGYREMSILLSLALLLVWIGLFPQPVLNTAEPALMSMQRLTHSAQASTPGKEFRP